MMEVFGVFDSRPVDLATIFGSLLGGVFAAVFLWWFLLPLWLGSFFVFQALARRILWKWTLWAAIGGVFGAASGAFLARFMSIWDEGKFLMMAIGLWVGGPTGLLARSVWKRFPEVELPPE